MKFIDLAQGSQEWLHFRRMGIGASDAPSIMGVGFKTPYQLFMDKMTGSEAVVNSAMQRGKDLEQPARELFIKMTGIEIDPAVVVHDEHEWQFASLDGIDKDKSILVEIKCPGHRDHQSAVEGMIPGKYYPQLQHQFAVTGLDRGYYFSFDGKNGVIVEIRRDDHYIKELIHKEKQFYQCMLDLEPPSLIEKDLITFEDEEWNSIAQLYIETKSQIESLEEKERLLRERLISIAGERNVQGCGIKLFRMMRKGAVDYTKIPELKDVSLDKYRKKPTDFWKISLTK